MTCNWRDEAVREHGKVGKVAGLVAGVEREHSQDAAVGEELDAGVEPFEGNAAGVKLLLADGGGVWQSVHIERAQHCGFAMKMEPWREPPEDSDASFARGQNIAPRAVTRTRSSSTHVSCHSVVETRGPLKARELKPPDKAKALNGPDRNFSGGPR